MPTRAIKAIFFTRFHHEKGSRVLHQIPEGSITPSTSLSALRTPLFAFDSATPYLIPTQQFCDRLLTFCVNRHRIIGYPVCIREGRYSRNEFIFNWAVVVEESLEDWVAYGEVVRKVGRLLRGLEEQGGFVSGEEDGMDVWGDDGEDRAWRSGGGSKVFALCEMLLEDLNNYAECMIPIDDSNTINLKLFPSRPPPPPIHAHQVPVLTISLSSLSHPLSSDLTLNRVLPHIDGIHSVAHIASLADTDLSLTRKAIQHLAHYGCLVLLDIFSYSAIYAPTAEIGAFITDDGVQEECIRYIRVPRVRWKPTGTGTSTTTTTREPSISSNASTSSAHSDSDASTSSSYFPSTPHALTPADADADADPDAADAPDITSETLITLYTTLRQGVPLRQWVLENLTLLTGIDVRRFITFGMIKGFLYRTHKYAIATHGVGPGAGAAGMPPAPPTSLQSNNNSHAGSSTAAHAPVTGHPSGGEPGAGHGHAGKPHPHFFPTEARMARLDSIISGEETLHGAGLLRFLDGTHCFDEICTSLRLPEAAVEARVKLLGDVQVFGR